MPSVSTNSNKISGIHDYIPEDNPYDYYKSTVQYQIKIPNKFIRADLKKAYNIHNRLFYILWIFIDRNRNYEGISHISLSSVLSVCGYNTNVVNKPKAFYDLIKCLLFLRDSYYIDFDWNYEDITMSSYLEIKIISSNFDSKNNYTLISSTEFELILQCRNQNLLIENVLTVYLYIISYIGQKSAVDTVCAFYGSLTKMSNDISMSKSTVTQCIRYLITGDTPLLIKNKTKTYINYKTKKENKLPNIYVRNTPEYQNEIDLAIRNIIEE